MTNKDKEFIGFKKGRFEVIEFVERDHANKPKFKCLCSCGNTFISRKNNLLYKTNSCGCLKKELIQERCQKSMKHNASRNMLNNCKRGAEERDLQCDLTLKQVETLIFKECYYCGDINTNLFKSGDREISHNGIDRVDNLKGYVKNNVVSCCKTCNRMKSALNEKDFINRILNIASRFEGVIVEEVN